MNPKDIERIEINFIQKERQRLECYRKDGCADYYFVPGKIGLMSRYPNTLVINISRSKSWRPEWLVLLHEIVEIIFVLHQKVSFKKIDAFDRRMKDAEDPGSNPAAPYHKAHMEALFLESYVSRKIGVDPESY